MPEGYNDGFGNSVSQMDAEAMVIEHKALVLEAKKNEVKNLITEKRYADAEALCRIKGLDIVALNCEVEER